MDENFLKWLKETSGEMQDTSVKINGVVDMRSCPISEYRIESTYRDIFLIINMLDDYVRIFETLPDRSFITDYYLNQFSRISESLSKQIQLDKEKMYVRCRRQTSKEDDTGKDALELL